MNTELTGVIAEHVAAVNAFDIDRIMATLPPTPSSTTTTARSGDTTASASSSPRVLGATYMESRGVDHHGEVIVRARYDGTYDKTNLPAELIMSNYFSLRDGRIISLTIIHNQPSPY